MTIRDLVDEVGRDAVRYFFLMRKSDTHFVFDVDLAKSQTEENPVFYVQMAHARHERHLPRCLARAGFRDGAGVDLAVLTQPEEIEAGQEAGRLPEMVQARQPLRWSQIASRPISRDWPGWRTRGITSTACWGSRRKRPARAGACGQTGARERPFTLGDSRPGTDVSVGVLVVGSIALDSVITPFGETADALGGAAVFFAMAGAVLAPVQVVGVVGATFPKIISKSWRRARGPGGGGTATGRIVPPEARYSYEPEQPRNARDPPRCLRNFQPASPKIPHASTSSSATSIRSCSSRPRSG